MPPLAAATVTAAVFATGYALRCLLSPYATCWRCSGTRVVERRIGRGHKPCRACRGAGRRLRVGRRIANLAIRGVRALRRTASEGAS